MKIYPPGIRPDFEALAIGEEVACRQPNREGHYDKLGQESKDESRIRNWAQRAGEKLGRTFSTRVLQADEPGFPGVAFKREPYKAPEARVKVDRDVGASEVKLSPVREYAGGLRIPIYNLREGKNPSGDPLKAQLLAMNKGDKFSTGQRRVQSMVARMGTSTGQAFRVEEDNGLWHITCLEDDIPEGAVWSEKKDRLTGWD
jgi:hypothetical protein